MLAESEPAVSNGDAPKLRAACENCRQSKVKCNLSGKDTCIRCLRHGLPCRYRVANRSGKPKGSKNRATLRKLGQLQDEKKPSISANGWAEPVSVSRSQPPRVGYDVEIGVDETSPQDTSQASPSDSPDSHGMNLADPGMLHDHGVEYPSSLGDPLSSVAPIFSPTSMSPTFLQKEFITKGLTSCPLAVHIPNALQGCECAGALMFHTNRLRHMVIDSIHLRVDQILQGIQTALTVCRGFLQCLHCPKDNTNLLYSVSMMDFTLQLFEFWVPYGLSLSSPSGGDHNSMMVVGYGEYEMSADETRRMRRFLLRGRLLQCKEALGLLKEAVEMSRRMSPELRDISASEGVESEWLQHILGGYEATSLYLHTHNPSKSSKMDRLTQLTSHLTFPHGLLANQVAIITGAGQGIGAETARLFANEGAKVVVADIDAEKATATAASINAVFSTDRALAVPGDILDDGYIEDLVARAAAFGGGKIHILVNNAGFTWDGVIHKMTDKQWEAMLAIHNTAPFKLVRALAKYFRVKDGEARVVINISSTSGVHGNAGQANYAVAKAGIIGLTKTITKEWGPSFGVRANTIAFGFVTTRLTAAKEDGAYITTPDGTRVALGIPGKQLAARQGDADTETKTKYPDIPLGRPASALEAARAVLGVASPLFSYVSGETIRVTGGRNT
ncbi:3-oxoacyl-reductase [Aspergillus heteromorphus CBS 117.55]|uniref:3-oxoacyl-reductase n=1 Tax=Aspergillus heteromorphus CBS 117.55 TaxID=1448321 RepID=A0A317X2B4_9EURO|nr:3-oxoacyl-reductase [Aspergillus heteromorphus CBS 117.55]PWY92495.1 3-oxoacyl-reductase [Aspergillus heteromorphus CBS 117.55]